MLEIFRRPRSQTPTGPDGPGDAPHRSHIFPKFLKRLSAVDRPTVLDLGRLTGGNIEIFARLGCRVQVEDVVSAADERAAGREGSEGRAPAIAPAGPAPVAEAGPLPAPAGDPGARPPGAAADNPPAHGAEGAPAARVAVVATDAPGPAGPAGPPARPGARPSRRIVLPPRHVGRTAMPAGAGGSSRPPAAEPTPLSAGFSYADGSFDAILAWDLLNYYDPQSARRMAGEIGRILRPGGLVYGWLHSRPASGPDGPRRFRIIDEARLLEEPFAGRPLPRHLYQNRDIEKMFADQRIVEMYFLKSGVREMLLEKRAPGSAPPPATPAARPRPRFRIE